MHDSKNKAIHAKIGKKDDVYEKAALKAGWGPAKRFRGGNVNSEGGIPFGKKPKGER